MYQPDTKIVQEATAILKEYFKSVFAVKNLFLLATMNEDAQVRQAACIYLRKIIGKLWMKVPVVDQPKIKEHLLERFVSEPVTIVKKAIADVIGALSKLLIPNREWNELFQFIL